MSLAVKVCGLTDPAAVDAAARGGARAVGFVVFPPSPRFRPVEAFAALAARVPAGVERVGVFVDPDDALLDATLAEVGLDVIQLHGGETPERVAAVRRRHGRPVMKALRVADAADLAPLDAYAAVADRLLFDAKPPTTPDALPGGNGLAFDWRLLVGLRLDRPWLLSGGLDAGNLAEAARLTGAVAVDVSSGVEARPGVKDLAKIEAFLRAAAGVDAAPNPPPPEG